MALSKQYDRFYPSDLHRESFSETVLNGWPRNREEAIIYAVARCICSAEKVLDIGCGNGKLLFQLKRQFKQLLGLEHSAHRLKQAEINLVDQSFTPLHGSAENMEFLESDSMDCVVLADTIEHIPDVYSAVAEIFRVLKPGGYLVINTPNIAFIKKRLLLALGRFPSTSQANEGLGGDVLFDGGHLHYFTFRSLSLLLRGAGFVIEGTMGYGKYGRFHDIYAPLLSGGAQVMATKPVL